MNAETLKKLLMEMCDVNGVERCAFLIVGEASSVLRGEKQSTQRIAV